MRFSAPKRPARAPTTGNRHACTTKDEILKKFQREEN
jgi:hypothetical protein